MKKKWILILGLVLFADHVASETREVININRNVDATVLRSNQLTVKPEGALQSRAFDFNPRLRQVTPSNTGDTLQLDFFDDSRFKAVIRHVTTGYDGTLGITADIVEQTFAACFIALSDAGITLSADLPMRDEQFFVANYGRQSLLSLRVLSSRPKKHPIDDVVIPPQLDLPDQTSMVQPRADDMNEHVVIDVMVVYTSPANELATKEFTSGSPCVREVSISSQQATDYPNGQLK